MGGLTQSIGNNTIDQVTGPDIALSGGVSDTTIENNILVVAAGSAIHVTADSEGGFASDYNLFDVSGTGVVGSWEGISFPTLASWYYELGFDQNSQSGNPMFVSPSGPDGILGFGAATGPTGVIDNSSAIGFTKTGSWTTLAAGVNGSSLTTAARSGATASWTFTGLTPGEVYQAAVTWPDNSDTGTAYYTVTNNGTVLTASILNQDAGAPNGLTSNGTTYAVVGQFVATGTTEVLMLSSDTGGSAIADAALLQPLGINGGADDDFHLEAGSPAIDAGDPTSPWVAEPARNGFRINQGYDGGSTQAQVSGPTQSIQVLTPPGLAKY